MNLKDHCQRQTLEAREKLAAETFDLVPLRKKVTERAMLGFGAFLVRPSEPVDLRETRAARAAVAALQAEGLGVSWVVEPRQTKENTTGAVEAFTCLRVVWLEDAPMWEEKRDVAAPEGQGEGLAADFVPGV